MGNGKRKSLCDRETASGCSCTCPNQEPSLSPFSLCDNAATNRATPARTMTTHLFSKLSRCQNLWVILPSGWFPPWTRLGFRASLGHSHRTLSLLFNQGETKRASLTIVLKQILWIWDQNTFKYLCWQFYACELLVLGVCNHCLIAGMSYHGRTRSVQFEILTKRFICYLFWMSFFCLKISVQLYSMAFSCAKRDNS